MEKNLVDFFKGLSLEFNAEEQAILAGTKVEEVLLNKGTGKTKVTLATPILLPVSLVEKIETKFKKNDLNLMFKLMIKPQQIQLTDELIKQYWEYIRMNKAQLLTQPFKSWKATELSFDLATKTFTFKAFSLSQKEDMLKDFGYYQAKFNQYGIENLSVQINVEEVDYQEINQQQNQKYRDLIESVQTQNQKTSSTMPRANRTGFYNQSFDKPTYEHLKDVEDNAQNVIIHAMVINKVIRNSKTGRKIYDLTITDNTSSFKAVYFAKDNTSTIFDELTSEELASEQVKELQAEKVNLNDWVALKGRTNYSTFDQEQVFYIDSFKKINKSVFQRKDLEKVKRVELHTHTKMSVMDGVSSAADYIKTAASWGWNAIAITDHLNVQAFPEVFSTLKAINKKRSQEDQFKVIYGSEMNLIDDNFWYVKNPTGQKMSEAKFVVFDLETTGLNPENDEIIEFGALIYNYQTGERKKIDLLIKPETKLKAFTKELTHLTDEILENKPTIADAFPEIYKIIEGAILVAHNANFDFNFLQSYAKKLGYPELTNTVIDTLTIARSYYPDLKNHRLGTVAKRMGILYDEQVAHRGDYDADVLTDVFEHMWTDIKKTHPIILDSDWELIRLENKKSDANYTKNRGHHATVLVKNQKGLKELYKLITKSHTENFFGSPKILKSELQNVQANGNLLVGSGCINGEIFDLARTGLISNLEKKLLEYDFIEIQPLSVYKHLLQNDSLNEEELVWTINLIIELAQKHNKILVATSDTHYLDPSLKQTRDVYINAKGLGGVNHPLYDYKNRIKDYPDQYLRTTNEMLAEFSWLNNPDLVNEIVIENTQKIAQMIDATIEPIKTGSYAPIIKNADQLLKDTCYQNAYKLYGNPLPKIVADRLEKELNSIIKHGFAVIYWISHKLVERSLNDGYLVGSRGSVGSSFVATMANITEVNPLKAHYRCAKCQYSDFETSSEYRCGYDLPKKTCPNCQTDLIGDGHDIPFETFLGFDGDKVPDIDLNFSGEYQPIAHNFTKEMFGENNVFRAGTISTVAEKTAFGYITGYFEKTHSEFDQPRRVEKERLAKLAEGVKRTTGQHPGGIIILPKEYEIEDFTPVNYPADDQSSTWLTTHFDFHSIHDNLLKMDILGHVDPTALKMLHDLTGVDPISIPVNDEKVYSLFSNLSALGLNPEQLNKEETGAFGIPEFGTEFVRGMLKETKPKTFADLVQISGLSHGTDVWIGNARELIKHGQANISTVIGCRDDIMVFLLKKGLNPKDAFNIMENVRKGNGVSAKQSALMAEHQVPQWYIDSCEKIKYMFPKAHATAYVLMAYRVAWYKVYYPEEYYATFFSTRSDAFSLSNALLGYDGVLSLLREIEYKQNTNKPVTKKETDLKVVSEVLLEMFARGFKLMNIDFNKSQASKFIIDLNENGEKVLVPPFNVIDSLGEAVANSIVEARKLKQFSSINDLKTRTQVTTTQVKIFEELKITDSLSNDEQLTFDF